MPFIMAKVNVEISGEQERQLKTRLGKAIELVPGKSEAYLMVGFEQDCHIYLRGENLPAAFIEVSVFGNEDHLGYDELTAEITKIFSSTLGISTKNIYVKFEDIANWGVGGMNIDRRDYL